MDDRPTFSPDDLAALVGSRLCHDLINPLGAIGNGVELMAMAGNAESPEMTLIGEAVRDAQARIGFFRIAFGATTPDQRVSRRDLTALMDGMYGNGGRLTVDFTPDGDMARTEFKLALLMLSCAETALPLGGEIKLTSGDGVLTLIARSKRINAESELWGLLKGAPPRTPVRPANVQFLLLFQSAEAEDRRCVAEFDDTTLTMRL